MANYVTCDDCHKKAEGKSCPSGWFDIDSKFQVQYFYIFFMP